MKKITLIAALLVAISMNAQLFRDNFQDGDISDWTLLDEDGDGRIFKIFDGSMDQSGEVLYLSSESYDNSTYTALTPDNYAISPEIDVTGNRSLELQYMVGAQDPNYTAENYTVFVSTGNTIADFMNTDPSVTVSFTENIGNDPAAAGNLVSRSLDLSSLEGASSLYIALRHHGTTDQFIINFNDIVLDGILSTPDNASQGFKHFMGNNELSLSAPSALENISLYNMLGQEVFSKRLNGNKESINLSSLQSGIYIAKVSMAGATKSFKLVKK